MRQQSGHQVRDTPLKVKAKRGLADTSLSFSLLLTSLFLVPHVQYRMTLTSTIRSLSSFDKVLAAVLEIGLETDLVFVVVVVAVVALFLVVALAAVVIAVVVAVVVIPPKC